VINLKKIFIVIAVTLGIIVSVTAGGLYYIDKKIYVVDKTKKNNTISNGLSDIQSIINSVDNGGGSSNIILAGTDSRSKDTASRTDSIIMATIDGNNKAVKLTSFMRDMYVSIPGYSKKYKINTAFYLGGPELLMETVNSNFNTKAQYYITIDFQAFQALVDKFHGVNIDVKDYEIKEMNKYIKEENWHNPDFIKAPGLQLLNGQQVLAYCRIRKVGNNDYERTERQRKVLALLIQKVKKESILKLPELFSTLLPYIKTNIPSSKLLALGISAYKFGNTQVASLRIPADGMYTSKVINSQDVLVPDFKQNIKLLNDFITSKDIIKDTTSKKTAMNNIQKPQ
jgi:polyisoprenyl-teichoic acid--peptidoglycan teichoic acid transferase